MFLGSLKSNIKSEYVAKFRIASMFQKRFSQNLFRLRHPGFIRIWRSSDGAGLSCIILLPKKSCSLIFENDYCVMFQNCSGGLRRSSAQWKAHIGQSAKTLDCHDFFVSDSTNEILCLICETEKYFLGLGITTCVCFSKVPQKNYSLDSLI